MAHVPYSDQIMKMTMHIEEEVLERVMKITGARTKTAAVKIADVKAANGLFDVTDALLTPKK